MVREPTEYIYSDLRLDQDTKGRVQGKIKTTRQHSLWVKLLRGFFPVMLFAIIGVLTLFIFTAENEKPVLKDVSEIEQGNEEIVFIEPVLKGVDGQGKPYSFTARKATQTHEAANEIHLDFLTAILGKGDEEALLEGDKATYLRNEKILTILSNGQYLTNEGGVAKFPTANIDTQNNFVQIEQGLIYTSPEISIKSDKADLNNVSKIYHFKGNVEATISNN